MTGKVRTRREDRPEVILDAAEEVLRRSGSRALTIEAVAATAGLSKGGVLHHYASKDALICALAARKCRVMTQNIAVHAGERVPDGVSPALALIASARETYGEDEGFPRELLFASAQMPDALAGYRTFLAQCLTEMKAIERKPGGGAILTFAILGVMVGRTLGFHDVSVEEANRLFDALEDLARGFDES